MIDWETMMELCEREAPDATCNEIRADGFGFCVLDAGHDGPHAYETYFPKKEKTTEDGMVLHCSACKNPLTTKTSSSKTGYWCDTCCYPPPLKNTYLAKPSIFKNKAREPNPFEPDNW
jgi:hypothetical protein